MECRQTMKKLLGIATIALVLCLYSGCFESHQEIWLEEDFSGRMTMSLEVKGTLALMMMSRNSVKNIDTLKNRRRIEEQGGVRVISMKTETFPEDPEDLKELEEKYHPNPLLGSGAGETTGDDADAAKAEAQQAAEDAAKEMLEQAKVRYSFELEFDSLEDLAGLQLMEEGDEAQGALSPSASTPLVYEETEEGILYQSEMEGPTITGNAGMLEDDAFSDARQTVTLHFPTKIIRSNAEEISDDGKTAYFRMDNPAEYLNDVKPMEVLIAKPGAGGFQISPTVIYGILGVLAAIGLVAGAYVLGRRSGGAGA
jgi:hypothetical protein